MKDILLLIGMIVCSISVGVISAVIAVKIIAAYYLQIINGFIENSLNQVTDLIRWAKGKDKS